MAIHTTSGNVYLCTHTINALAERIASIEPCPHAGKVTPDQIKLAFAEQNVWPMSILLDAALNGHA